MTGRELIVALKDECPSAVPVVLTGYGTVERAVDLMRLGAFDVLTKPCRARGDRRDGRQGAGAPAGAPGATRTSASACACRRSSP